MSCALRHRSVPGTVLGVLSCLLLLACGTGAPGVSQVAATPVKNKYAVFFSTAAARNYTLLVTWLNAERTDSVAYVLYSGDRPALKGNYHFIETPVSNIACLGSVFLGFLERLRATDKVTAVDNLDFISNPLVLHAAPAVKELSRNGQLNIEQTLLSGARLILTNPSGDKMKDFDPRLLDARIVPLVCADYFEEHPLGRAEWIKVLGLLLNKQHLADSLFLETEKKYLELKSVVDTCKYRPTVFTELKTSDTWFVAGGKSSMARLLADAGADYLWKDNGKTTVTALNMEQVMQRALDADYWINLHLCNSASDLLKLDRRYAGFKAFQLGNIYNNNARTNDKGANPYWEEGLCNPDRILDDLIQIFHPTLHPVRKLNYYQQLK